MQMEANHDRKNGGYHYHRKASVPKSYSNKPTQSTVSVTTPAFVDSATDRERMDALVSLLIKKGVITQAELNRELKK